MKRKNLDKRTLKWVKKQIRKIEDEAFAMAEPRGNVNSTSWASRTECAGRGFMLRAIADALGKGRKL